MIANPQTPIIRNNLSSYLRKTHLLAKENLNAFSSDTNTHKSSAGTSITIAEAFDSYGADYVGLYDVSSSYGVNDMVTVSASMTAMGYTIPAGTFVCKCPVPAYYSDDEIIDMASSEYSSSYGESISSSGNNYFPAMSATVYWEPIGTSAAATNIKEYKVQTIHDNYLSCYPVSRASGSITTDTSSIVFVAKPYDLRYSTWSGSTNSSYSASVSGSTYADETRTYQSASVTVIVETLKPTYSGSFILAAQNTTLYSGSTAISWTDVNVDARKYLPDGQTMTICETVNGVSTTKKFVYWGGKTFI